VTPKRWIWVLGSLVVVLAIALVVVLVTRDNGNNSASPTTTSTSASTTTSAVTTTLAPTTTRGSTPTTASLPVITNDPESYAKYLFAAWQAGNQQAANMVASGDAVSQMFAQAYQSSNPYTFGMCGPAAGSVYCTWTAQNGGTITMAVRNTTGGLPILVVNVMRS
jgi:hypothetical protein